MLEHCTRQLQLAMGEIEQSNVEGSPMMRTRFGRWFALYVLPWSRGLPTPRKMNIIKSDIPVADFETHKKTLIETLALVSDTTTLSPHPFFGSLSQKEWGRLIWKHLDHHLKQFGC